MSSLKGLDLSNAEFLVVEWQENYAVVRGGCKEAPECSLIDLPIALTQLRSLGDLYLHGNHRLDIPPEILGPKWSLGGRNSPSAILEYYFSTRGDQGSALRELKLLVVGRGGAGKTSR